MNNRPTANATIAAVHDPKPDVVPSSVIIACAVVFAVPPVACPNLSRTVTPTPIIIAKTQFLVLVLLNFVSIYFKPLSFLK